MFERRRFKVPVCCPSCSRLVTISYQPALEPGDPTIYKWTCPHEGCDGEGTFYLYGEFLGSEPGLQRGLESVLTRR